MSKIENNTGERKPCGYPGEYIPPPFVWEDVISELNRSETELLHPHTNISETDEYVKVEIAAPGHRKEDFIVSVHNGQLSLIVLRRKPEASSEDYHQHEFSYGCFAHRVSLPDNIDPDFSRGEYLDGVLTFYFPKVKRPVPNIVHRLVIY